MNKYKQNSIRKAIPQKGDIIDIRKFLPRGTISKVARNHNVQHQKIGYIAKGQVNDPIIYAELLEIAENYKDQIQLKEINRQKAEKLLNL